MTLHLLDELTAAQSGITANKAQCKLLHELAVHVVGELQHLPQATQDSFAHLGTFAGMYETLRAATDFCRIFKGHNALRRILKYKSDAERFNDFKCRLSDVMQDAGLPVPLDDLVWRTAWRAAQEADAAAWEDINKCLADADLLSSQCVTRISRGFGLPDSTPGQADETCAIVESLRQFLSRQKSCAASTGGSDAPVHDMLVQLELWEINPREVKFDQMEDKFGDMRRVSLGEGTFGKVYRGSSVRMLAVGNGSL